MAKKTSKKIVRAHRPIASKNLPATYGALEKLRGELKSDFTSVNIKIDSLQKKIQSQFVKLESRLETKLDTGFVEVDLKYEKLDSRFTAFEAKTDARFAEFEARTDARFTAFESKMDARFAEMDAKFEKVDIRFAEMNAKMDEKFLAIDSKFLAMDSKFEDLKSTSHRMLALLEEQNSRNRSALDGYSAVYGSLKNLELRVEKVESNQFELAKYLREKNI